MSSFNPALLRLVCLEMEIVPNISLDKVKKAKNNRSKKELLRKFGNCNEDPDNIQRRRRRDLVRSHVRNQSLTKWNNE